MDYRDAMFWLFAVGVVYGASFLPELLGYAEAVH